MLHQVTNRCEEIVALLLEHTKDDESWTLVKHKKGVMVHIQHEEENPVKSARAKGIVPCSVPIVLRLLQSIDYYPEIDPLYQDGRVVEKLDERHELLYSSYSSGFDFLISPRDFFYVEGRRKFEDRTRVVACWSIERDDVPPVPGKVRAHIFYSGWVIRPCTPSEEEIEEAELTNVEAEDWCEATFVAQVDIKGWIPTWVVNKLSGTLANSIHQLRRFIAKKGLDELKQIPLTGV